MSTSSRSFAGHEYGREIAFAVGAFLGVSVFAFGIATIVLAMSVGFRRGTTLVSPTMKTVLLVLGAVLLVGGILTRIYKYKLEKRYHRPANVAAWVGLLLGSGMILLHYSSAESYSAPYLVQPGEKLVLFVVGYVLIIVGLLIVRAAARIVGW